MKLTDDASRINLLPTHEFKPIDDVLVDVFARHNMGRLGGASGRGWSSYATFQRCPYLYKVKYVDRERGTPALALETGSAFHTFMALHYTWMLDEHLTLTPEVCREELLDNGARPEGVLAGWQCYDNYRLHYEQDYIYPLGIEEFAEGDHGNTCRYDLIARVDKPQPGIIPGTYIVEHKTAARFTMDLLQGWHNDGEILGQIMVWKQAKLDKKYGKLRGTIVNIVGKQKKPQFERVIVPAQAWHVREHTQDLQLWNLYQQLCRTTDNWPKARNNCISKYGMCDLFTHCSTNDKLTPLRRLDKAMKAAADAAKSRDALTSSQEALALFSDVGNMANANEPSTSDGVPVVMDVPAPEGEPQS
jgi:hypothetical protein